MISKKDIDSGKGFDWGRTSADYAKYRDIYPPQFYEKLLSRGIGTKGQRILDLGTGTGVLPRAMYPYGAHFTGTDISPEQIVHAKRLAEEKNMDIDFFAIPTEQIDYPDESFDIITACQCYWYFDHAVTAPKLAKLLKKGGRFALLYMAWLPGEDAIAEASENLVLKYNPAWTGGHETKHEIFVPAEYLLYFGVTYHEEYDLDVPFTRDTWNGRMKACRGVGASMTPEQISAWEAEHLAMLNEKAAESFTVHHYAAICELTKK